MRIVLCLSLVGLFTISRAEAQQRPLVTEDPETVGSGLVLLEAGVDYGREIFYPVSGLTGNLLRLPTVGLSLGVSSIAEIQIDGSVYNRLTVTDSEDAPLAHLLDFSGDRSTSAGDLLIGTKVRLVSETEGRPAMGLRFATNLPTASSESGIGVDTMNFFGSFLIGKTVQSIRVVGNFGVGILPDPLEGHRQNDVVTYGLSLARAVRQGLEVVGEVNGRINTRDEEPPAGTDSRGEMRIGARFTQGTVRVDGGLIIGMTPRDPSFGFTAGLTWVFRAFTIP